jgi:ABC-type branched-subunit amino acid transport system substrate-binding protein
MIENETGPNGEPYFQAPAEVGVNAVNAAGGIMGHKVVLDFCDDQSSVQNAAVCAQKLLVQDKVLLLMDDNGLEDAAVAPVLNKVHGIQFPAMGGYSADLTAPNVFIIYPSYAFEDAEAKLLPAGSKVAFMVANNPIAVQSAVAAKATYPGSDTVKLISVPITSTDFQTPCEQAKEMNATAVIPLIVPTQVVPMMQACTQLGQKMTWVIGGTTMNSGIASALTSLHLSSIIPSGFSQKAVDAFNAAIAKYGPKVSDSVNDMSLQAFVGMSLLPSVVKGAGSLDGAKIGAWLSQQTAFQTMGYTPPINFTSTNQPLGAKFSQIKNPCVYSAKVVNGALVSTNTPVCVK